MKLFPFSQHQGWCVCSAQMKRQLGLTTPQHYKKNALTWFYGQSTASRSTHFGVTYISLSNIYPSPYSSVDLLLSCSLDPVSAQFLLTGSRLGVVALHDTHHTTEDVGHFIPRRQFPMMNFGSGEDRHKNNVTHLEWYPVDTGIFTSTCPKDRSFYIWDTKSFQVVERFEFSDTQPQTHNMAWHDPVAALACSTGEVRVCDLRSGSCIQHLTRRGDDYRPGRRLVLTRAYDGVNEMTATGCTCVRWHPAQAAVVAAGYDDGHVLLWDIRSSRSYLAKLTCDQDVTASGRHSKCSGYCIQCPQSRVKGLCYSSDGSVLVTQGRHYVHLRDGTTQQTIGHRDFKHINGVSLVPDTDLLITMEGKRLVCYDTSTFRGVAVLEGHTSDIVRCAVDPALHRVFTVGSDTNVVCWDYGWRPYDEVKEKKTTDGDASSNKRTKASRVGSGVAFTEMLNNSRSRTRHEVNKRSAERSQRGSLDATERVREPDETNPSGVCSASSSRSMPNYISNTGSSNSISSHDIERVNGKCSNNKHAVKNVAVDKESSILSLVSKQCGVSNSCINDACNVSNKTFSTNNGPDNTAGGSTSGSALSASAFKHFKNCEERSARDAASSSESDTWKSRLYTVEGEGAPDEWSSDDDG